MTRLALLAGCGLAFGCGSPEGAVPDAKPVSAETRSKARAKEIDAPRKFAERRGLGTSAISRTVETE